MAPAGCWTRSGLQNGATEIDWAGSQLHPSVFHTDLFQHSTLQVAAIHVSEVNYGPGLLKTKRDTEL